MKSLLAVVVVIFIIPAILVTDVAASKSNIISMGNSQCSSCQYGCSIIGRSTSFCRISCEPLCSVSLADAESEFLFNKCGACKSATRTLVKRLGCGGGPLKLAACLATAETLVGPIICAGLVLTANHFITQACAKFTRLDEVANYVANHACPKAHLC
jgi:hypothetical protein